MDPSSAADWVTWGPLGLFVLAFLMGWAIPGPTHKRETDRGDRLEKENRALHTKIEDQVLPLVHDAIAAIRDSQEGS